MLTPSKNTVKNNWVNYPHHILVQPKSENQAQMNVNMKSMLRSRKYFFRLLLWLRGAFNPNYGSGAPYCMLYLSVKNFDNTVRIRSRSRNSKLRPRLRNS